MTDTTIPLRGARFRVSAAVVSMGASLRRHPEIIAILFLGFVARLYLSGHQSYWLDEYLSVVIYGTNHASALDAVRFLADRSIHPPLFQFTLWHWMTVFGDSEIATRALSGLYIAGATLSLYLLGLHAYGKRMGLAIAIFFSLMYVPVYYGMESRSYAQTIFLASLSSYLLIRWLHTLPNVPAWRDVIANPWAVGLALANLGLLLTHYYNAFFLAAQGLFLIAVLLARYRLSLATFVGPTFVGGVPLAGLAAIWGPVMWASYQARTHRFTVDSDGLQHDPLSLFHALVVDVNASHGRTVMVALAALILAATAMATVRLWRRYSIRDLTTIYSLAWALLPPAVALLGFWLAGHERYSSRYFVFCTPPLAILLAVGLELPFRLIAGWRPAGRAFLAWSLPLTLIAAALLVAPEGLRAATQSKHDHRGYARQVADIVRQNPDRSYIVYEVSSRPLLTHYLNQMRPHVSVTAQITRGQERSGEFVIDDHEAEIAAHDYLLIVFTHDRARNFPRLLAYLGERYVIQHSLQNHMGRGVIIYSTERPSGVELNGLR